MSYEATHISYILCYNNGKEQRNKFFSFFLAKDEQERTREMVDSSQVCASSF